MYLARSIDEILKRWKSSLRRCPLILRGARQVGKSASVREFGKTFASFVQVDFEETPEAGGIFPADLVPARIVRDLESITNQRIVPGETLLFLDEIQSCSRALTSLRYFREKMPELHVVAAGSLLEFALGQFSFPVGRVEYQTLYPMSFREFLDATSREILAERLPNLSSPFPPLSRSTSEKLYAALREYLVVGGMPEVVATYRETNSFLEVLPIQDRLFRAFRDDVPKYVTGDLQIRNVVGILARLPALCGEQITYTKLLDDDPKRNKISVFLLEQANLVHRVRSVSPAGLPLGATASEKAFKAVFLDVGLAQRQCGRTAREIYETPHIISSFRGQIAEQFCGQQLLASGHGSEGGSLYYWRRDVKGASAEVDYVLARDSSVIPVEVKSGASGSLKSLHLLMKTFGNVQRAYCMQEVHEVSVSGNIYFVPLYCEI